jgi:hypothetical protein
MYDRLVQTGVPAQLIIVKNAGHSMIEPGASTTPTLAEINQTIVDFLSKYLK